MINELARKNLLTIHDAYAAATGLSDATISKASYGNGTFMRQLRKREVTITLEKLDSVLTWFSENWPEDTALPYLPVINMSPLRKAA